MIRSLFSWKTLLALIAIIIVLGTLFYSRYLAGKVSEDERRKVDLWVTAQRTIMGTDDPNSLELASKISLENKEIPIIETDEKGIPTGNYLNLDSIKVQTEKDYLLQQVKHFEKIHDPIILVLSDSPYQANKYYYGTSVLQREVRYFPIAQLLVVSLFIAAVVLLLLTGNKSTQNRLWAGMAKETAHQLGTPVSSLQGWIEVLRENEHTSKLATEIDKDVKRLQLITDRFGKIGSIPKREQKNIVEQVELMVDYMKKRAGANVSFAIDSDGKDEIYGMISPPLFDWVIENLLKNSLDAMEGKGSINIKMREQDSHVIIDVTDSGKGIQKGQVKRIFNPGFTTKKRGWGLGLALTKRIIEQYHNGEIMVKWSEPGKGTTFRIII